jgi:peptidoglycan/LPS O-acetylase OafA/YrhL
MRMPNADSKVLAYRPDIDGLRGIAVSLVLLYHAFPNVRSGGFIGVDVFFVISGYLISGIVLAGLRAKKFRLLEFYRRRVRRIVPALLALIAACSIVGWFLLLPNELRWLGRSITWCALFLANIFFSRTGGYFDRAAELNPLLHLWSLGVEEQFYLAWPVLLMFTEKYGVTLRVLAALISASLALSIWGTWYAPTAAFYYPVTRAWELGMGGMLAAWQIRMAHAPAAPSPSSRLLGMMGNSAAGVTSSWVGLALIVAGGICWSDEQAIPGIWCTIPVAGATLLIGAGTQAPVNRLLLSSRPLIFLGRISYSLYLWHWPLFSFARIVLGRAPQPALAAALVVVAFVAACASYRWIEVPMRFGTLGRKWVPGLLAGLAGLALVGIVANQRWIGGRLRGPAVTAWSAAANDWRVSSDTKVDKRTGIIFSTVHAQNSAKTLFVGDSHMQQYWPRVEQVIELHPDRARTAEFVTQPGCPPLPGINGIGRGRNCSDLFQFAIQQAFQPGVEAVVFGAFWEDYFLGEYSVPGHGARVYNVSDSKRQMLEVDSPGARLAFDQFAREVSGLVASGRRVFIVLSNPTSPQFDPLFPAAIRLSLHVQQDLPFISGPRVDATSFESFVAPVIDRLRAIAEQSGATAVDPRDALCEGMICPSTNADGLPRYLDSNHLGATSARENASFIDEMLQGPSNSQLPRATSAPAPGFSNNRNMN